MEESNERTHTGPLSVTVGAREELIVHRPDGPDTPVSEDLHLFDRSATLRSLKANPGRHEIDINFEDFAFWARGDPRHIVSAWEPCAAFLSVAQTMRDQLWISKCVQKLSSWIQRGSGFWGAGGLFTKKLDAISSLKPKQREMVLRAYLCRPKWERLDVLLSLLPPELHSQAVDIVVAPAASFSAPLNLPRGTLSKLAPFLARATHLLTLDVRSNSAPPADIAALAAALDSLHALTRLDVGYNRGEDAIAQALLPAALTSTPALADLSVAGNLRERAHAQSLASALAKLSALTGLTRLDASANLLGQATLPTLLDTLPAFPALAALDISPCEAVSGAALEPHALAAALAAAAACAALTSLALRGARAPDAAAPALLAEDLPAALSSLRTLNFAHSEGLPWASIAAAARPEALVLDRAFSDTAAAMPEDAVAALREAGPQLAELSVSGCINEGSRLLVPLVAHLGTLTGLTALDLSHSHCVRAVPGAGKPAAGMVPALNRLTALRRLKIAGKLPWLPSFSWAAHPPVLKQIAALTALTALDLSCQDLSVAASPLSAHVLPLLPHLAELRLPFSNLTAIGGHAFTAAVTTLHALTRLDVRGCGLGASVSTELVRALAAVPSLEALDVSLLAYDHFDMLVLAAAQLLYVAPRLRDIALAPPGPVELSDDVVLNLANAVAAAPGPLERVQVTGIAGSNIGALEDAVCGCRRVVEV